MDHSKLDPIYTSRTAESAAVRNERQSLESFALGRERTDKEEERYQELCQAEQRLEFPENRGH